MRYKLAALYALGLYIYTQSASADIDVLGFLNQAALENLAADPSCSPASTCPDGRVYWNTVANQARIWDGASWAVLGGAAVPDPLLLGNGSGGNPTYSFTNDSSSGLYLKTVPGEVSLAISGADALRCGAATCVTETATHRFQNGTVTTPSITFESETSLGFGRRSTNHMGLYDSLVADSNASGYTSLSVNTEATNYNSIRLISGGMNTTSQYTPALVFGSDDPDLSCPTQGCALAMIYGEAEETYGGVTNGDMTMNFAVKNTNNGNDNNFTTVMSLRSGIAQILSASGTASRPIYSFAADANAGLSFSTAPQMSSADGTVSMFYGNAATVVSEPFQNINGSLANPAYGFSSHPGDGLYMEGTNPAIANNGVQTFIFGAGTSRSAVEFQAPASPAASQPTYTFTGDTDTGISRPNANDIAIVAGGTTYFSGSSGNARVRIPGSGSLSIHACVGGTGAGTQAIDDCSSSIRFKENITDITEKDSSKLWDLRPVVYKWKNRNEENYGFIAEEVNEILPRLTYYATKTDGEGNTEILKNDDGTDMVQGVHYQHITALLLAEMKKLKARIEQLEAAQ